MRDGAYSGVERIARISREHEVEIVEFNVFWHERDAVGVAFKIDRSSEGSLLALIGRDRIRAFGVLCLLSKFVCFRLQILNF